MEHLKEIILDYATTDSSNRYAIMVTGEWGSGKTYYFKEVLRGEIEKLTGKKVIYLSLNGVKSHEEIYQNLVGEKLWIKKVFSSSKAGKITYGILKSVFNIGINAFQLTTGSKLFGSINLQKDDFSKIDINELANFSKNIICFDDLERVSKDFDFADVLGFINSNFVEHEGIKVIIICNEDEIISKGSKVVEDEIDMKEVEKRYHRIKEKIIGRTLKFTSNIEEILDHFINSYKEQEKQVYEFLSANKEFLLTKILASKEENLRTILFMLDNLKAIVKKGRSDYIAAFGQKLILSNIVFSFEEKRGGLSSCLKVEDLPWVLQTNSNNVVMLSEGIVLDVLTDNPEDNALREINPEKKKRKEYRDYLKETYWGGETYEFFSSIFTFVKTGYLNADKLNSELSVFVPKEEPPHIQILNKISRSYDLPDVEFIESIPQLIWHIENGDYNLAEFIEASKILHDLSSNQVIKDYPKETLNEFLLNNIGKTRKNTSIEDLQEVRIAMGYRTHQFQESQNLLEAIIQLQKLITSDEKELKIDGNLQEIKEKDYINVEREDYRDIIIFHSLDSITEVIQYKYDDSPRKLLQIIDLFDDTYPTSYPILNTVLPQEAEKLKSILEWVRKFKESIPVDEKPISEFWIRVLLSRLEKIVSSLEIDERRIARLD